MMKNFLVYPVLFMMLVAGLITPASRPASAAPQAWPKIALVEYAKGLDQPVHLTHAGDGSGRLFVVEQAGRIQIVKNGAVQSTFLDISGKVLSPASGGEGEEGLLSLAFPPGFASGVNHFYVYYTNKKGNNQVSRFTLSANPNQADPASEKLIIAFAHPTYSNHNGGQLAFGPDGYLYIGTGDGGGSGDPQGNAQNPGSLLGKLLRIDVEQGQAEAINAAFTAFLPTVFADSQGQPPVEKPYTIPPGNPFVGQPGYKQEIWALGLRNPWRFSFDRQTGDLLIGDVGQGNWEEIDFQPASSDGGQNYGWNILEGFACYLKQDCDKTGMTPPVHVYATHEAGICSVTGGYVYRGSQYPDLQGIYLYADYCSGRIWGLKREGSQWVSQELKDTTNFISSFGQGPDGSLYVLDRASGNIYKVTVTGS